MSHCFPIYSVNFKPHILLELHPSPTAKMATTASSTDVSSLTAVLNLYRTIRSRAPDDAGVRPVASPKSQADVPRYFDEAIGLLGRATNDAYVDHDHIQVDLDAFQFKVDREFQYVHKWFEKVDGRLDQVDGRLTNMECHHKAMKDNIDKQFGQNLAFQRNRLVRVLEAQIERIAEPKVDEMGAWRDEVADAFPTTVW